MLNILPRDEKYFDQFNELAQRIHESARILNRFFGGESPVPTVADQIKRLEHECDEISHQILRSIDRTFITPIDREDIHQLAVRLDDVIDLIDGTVRRLVLFKITEPTPVSQRLSQTIVEITAEMVEAVSALRAQKGVIPHCIRMKELENQGDVAYHEAVASLFAGQKDPIEVMKWKDIFDQVEDAIDGCQSISNTMESIALKYA